MTDQPAAGRDLLRDPFALDRIGIGNGDVRMIQRQRTHLGSRLFRFVQPARQRLDGGGIHVVSLAFFAYPASGAGFYSGLGSGGRWRRLRLSARRQPAPVSTNASWQSRMATSLGAPPCSCGTLS
ncbi:hypothetical protein G6F57_021627 [Rhizopus arrhizus]|nr:hypothetical protein G6F57_021627 [Rhizopus arrhizus]